VRRLAGAAQQNDRWIDMRIFLAGATGAIGRRLVPLLTAAGHTITGTTRSADAARDLEAAGVRPAIVDVYDGAALTQAAVDAKPEIVIHQLTDLPRSFDPKEMAAASPRNARLRIEGTRNLIAAAKAAGARRFIVQSIAFVYAPGAEPHAEDDPLNLAEGPRLETVRGVADMERQVLTSGLEGIVLRYGFLQGPGTWYDENGPKPALHVDAAAQAAALAVSRGATGIYNIANDDGVVSIDKARRELGFDPAFRLSV
jgi:nucleoside-diphosphate-sugar epimerase